MGDLRVLFQRCAVHFEAMRNAEWFEIRILKPKAMLLPGAGATQRLAAPVSPDGMTARVKDKALAAAGWAYETTGLAWVIGEFLEQILRCIDIPG